MFQATHDVLYTRLEDGCGLFASAAWRVARRKTGDVFTVVGSSSGATGPGRCGDRLGGIDSIEAVVRHLVQLVRRQHQEPAGAVRKILLDLLVDDVRCRLEMVGSAAVSPVGGPLSRRETEVALMVAQGYPNKTIAAMLEISSFTVSSYLRRIFAKLGVNSRAAMVAQALENHLLPEPLTRINPADMPPSAGETP